MIVLWEASDRVCGKRLKALLAILLPAMERNGHLKIVEEIRHKILSISAATIARLPLPGSMEMDLVALCGGVNRGSYVHSLVLTDIASGWTEAAPIVVREGTPSWSRRRDTRSLMPNSTMRQHYAQQTLEVKYFKLRRILQPVFHKRTHFGASAPPRAFIVKKSRPADGHS